MVEYAFKCRSEVKLGILLDYMNYELDELCKLILKDDEIEYLVKNIDERFNSPEFKGFKLSREDIKVTNKDGDLQIVVKGIWWKVILFEVFVLAIVNESYSDIIHPNTREAALLEGQIRLTHKINQINEHTRCCETFIDPLAIMEFGTRRRFSAEWQDYVLKNLLLQTKNIIGTSNVALAKKYNIPALGTMAHETFQVGQGVYHPVKSQIGILREWFDFFGEKFSVALTDIFPTHKFLKDFDLDLAQKYKGLRHDSGNPAIWADEMINMYEGYHINPDSKKLTFSDGLDIPTAIDLHDEFRSRIPVSFGIGTNLTNDMGSSHKALQVVMKIVRVDGQDVAKISNNPGKSMCENKDYQNWLVGAIEADCA